MIRSRLIFIFNSLYLSFILLLFLSSCVSRKQYNTVVAKLDQIEAEKTKLLKDSDGDGVSDYFDKEEKTPEGHPVNPKGISLDSDFDGIKDGVDEEPFSPAGYPVNGKGVAQIPEEDRLSRDDINRLIEDQLSFRKQAVVVKSSGTNYITFPDTYFKAKTTKVHSDSEIKVYKAARVLKDNPRLRLVIEGFTHPTKQKCLDLKLSYERAKVLVNTLVETYGIARNRLELRYQGGEGMQFSKRMFNDRVELYLADEKDGWNDMGPPVCE